MSKKGGFAIVLLVILASGVILFGMNYSKKQQKELMAVSEQTDQQELGSTKEDTTEQLANYENSRQEMSALDYIKYVSLVKEEEVSLSFYGDIAEEEQWISEAEQYINEQTNKTIKVNRLVNPDYDSYKLISENKVVKLAETKPDVIFFQLPAYADQKLDISLVDSSEYLTMNYEAIKDALPESLVVFISPNPSSSEKGNNNSRTLDYTSYLNEMMSTIQDNEWISFDLHERYLEKLEADGVALESTLLENGRTLNTEGTDLYSTLFEESLDQKIDTTSGM
ncbi:hypothetical protein [Carnobacterium sp. FSL W8-0810]|uniref:hypothetical protein n=1 Tax=Carnobacterium sp. FSL W8-0810 TaxID=2954705 RepID=UPI0030FCF43E